MAPKPCLLILAWLLGLCPLAAAARASATLPVMLSVCDAEDEWPPYAYFERKRGQKTGAVVGFSVDYLARVLQRKGMTATVEMLPWQRCMAGVESGRYDLLLNAANDEYRARKYLVTKPYYHLELVYFYDQQRSKPVVGKVADLKKLRLCGVAGYSYAAFELAPHEIDTGARGFSNAIAKLKGNRCDAVPERLEIVLAAKRLGFYDFSAQLVGYEHVAGVTPSPFHMMISRKLAYSGALLKAINEGIDEVNANGVADEIKAKFGLRIPAK